MYFFLVFDQKKNSFLVLSHEWRTKTTSKTASSLFSVCRVEASWQGYPTTLVTNRWNRSHLSWIFSNFFTFALHTLFLTQMCPSPSPMLSRAYFGALKWLQTQINMTGERGSGKSLKCFNKICDEYCSSIAAVFFSFFLGPKETRNSLHFSPLVSKKTSDIQAGRWHDSLERRFYSLEVRWRFASFART